MTAETENAAKQRVMRVDQALAIRRGDHHGPAQFGELEYGTDGFAAIHTYQENHIVGLGQHVTQRFKRIVVHQGGWLQKRTQVVGGGWQRIRTAEHIHRNAQMNRPHGNMGGSLQCGNEFVFKLLRMGYQRVVAGAVLQHGQGIDSGAGRFLQRMPAERGQGRLPGNDQHRDIVVVGAGHTGDQVGDAGAGGGAADPDLAGFARITVGHEGGSCLVPRQDVAYTASAAASGDGVEKGMPNTCPISICSR